MSDILVLAAHPDLAQSRVNQAMLRAARNAVDRVRVRDLYALYEAMARTCLRFPGWRAGFLVGNPLLEQAFSAKGLRARIKKPLANGPLRSYFYLYE